MQTLNDGYLIVARDIENGLLQSQPARTDEGQPRRILQLTVAGKQTAAKKAAEAIANEPLESPIFALALSCVDELDSHLRLLSMHPHI